MENKGLQKLTDIEASVDLLLKKSKIEPADIIPLSNEAKGLFWDTVKKEFSKVTGDARDKFLLKIDAVVDEDTRNQLWENNHYIITTAISKLMRETEKMPTKNQIAAETGLSRQTVHKHLKDYSSHPLYVNEIAKFRFMIDRVLSSVFTLATNGDVKAARLYLEATGSLLGQSGANKVINTQNNYIQINQMRLSQETIKLLNPNQLFQIESILKSVLPNYRDSMADSQNHQS